MSASWRDCSTVLGQLLVQLRAHRVADCLGIRVVALGGEHSEQNLGVALGKRQRYRRIVHRASSYPICRQSILQSTGDGSIGEYHRFGIRVSHDGSEMRDSTPLSDSGAPLTVERNPEIEDEMEGFRKPHVEPAPSTAKP